MLLGRPAGRLLLWLLFFGVITPLAVLLRLFGKDILRLKRDVGAASYWISRDPPGPQPESMTRQS
jgi:hypothetical protein